MSKIVTVLGVGGAGTRIVNALSKLSASSEMRLIAIDTDRESLSNCAIAEEDKLLAAESWRDGKGCGGNILNGQTSFARERDRIRALIGKPEMLLITGGLGGGTATGGMSVILSECRKFSIPSLYLLTLPFTLEGHGKRKNAEEALQNEILPLADAVVCLPNDLLFSVLPPESSLLKAFELADAEVAKTALALANVMRYGNLLSASSEDIAEVLHKKKSFCGIGSGCASGENRCPEALEKMLASPLSGGMAKLKNADAVIFSLLGGEELSMGEVKSTLEHAASLVGREANILVSTGILPELGNEVFLTGVFINFDPVAAAASEVRKNPIAAAAKKRNKNSLTEAIQGELDLGGYSKGDMEGTTSIIWNGEDLDIPTFYRRKITVNARPE